METEKIKNRRETNEKQRKFQKPCSSNTHTHTHKFNYPINGKHLTILGNVNNEKYKIKDELFSKKITRPFVCSKGITLIALVVTIVVLLILAGVSINAILGDDGIIAQAKKAAQAAKDAATNDEQNLKDLADTINSMVGSSEAGGQTDPDKNAIAKEYGKKQESENKQITDKSGNILITIPKGFTLVDPNTDSTIEYADKNNPTVDDGLVIKDDAGNEFVWIPCKEEEYVKHAYNSSSTNDAGTNIADNTGGWNTTHYRAYTDWKEDGTEANKGSIRNNGGFYIARYEAGVPREATNFYVDKNSLEKDYPQDKGEQETSVTGLKPVSKKDVQAWNLITQEHAKEVSEAMYTGGSYGVTSKLVDGIAWDRVVTWMSADSRYSNIYKDSTQYGNYTNSTGDNEFEVPETLWAEHLYKFLKEGNVLQGWCIGTHYQYGEFISGYTDTYTDLADASEKYNNYDSDLETYRYQHFVELATGATTHTKIKNIYDMAGNMFEWTTEYGYHDKGEGSTKYAVIRGGAFNGAGDGSPVSRRTGTDNATTDVYPSDGFRVILYIKQ